MKPVKLMVALTAAALLSACGTAVNSTIAAYEQNIATNAIQAEVNQANAATFAMLNTPVYVLPFLQPNQRACISDLSVTDAAKQLTNIINATAPAVPVPQAAPAAAPATGAAK